MSNLFTHFVEALTASESVHHLFNKGEVVQRVEMVAKGVNGTNVLIKADLCGCSGPKGLFEKPMQALEGNLAVYLFIDIQPRSTRGPLATSV